MTLKITCCVCDRPGIETNTCPNCGTDLSMVRMLAELPVQSKVPTASMIESSTPNVKRWGRLLGTGSILLGLGVVLGFSSNQIIATESLFFLANEVAKVETSTTPNPTTTIPPSLVSASANDQNWNESNTIDPPLEVVSCGGFYYTIISGDTLSKIAWTFYHDSHQWFKLITANPKLGGKEDQLIIGDIIFIPNQEEQCPNS